MRRLRAALILSPLADVQPTPNRVCGSFTSLTARTRYRLKNSTALNARASDGEVECAAEGSGMVPAVEEGVNTDMRTRPRAVGVFISPNPPFRPCVLNS
jgi:hypothetical protein